MPVSITSSPSTSPQLSHGTSNHQLLLPFLPTLVTTPLSKSTSSRSPTSPLMKQLSLSTARRTWTVQLSRILLVTHHSMIPSLSRLHGQRLVVTTMRKASTSQPSENTRPKLDSGHSITKRRESHPALPLTRTREPSSLLTNHPVLWARSQQTSRRVRKLVVW